MQQTKDRDQEQVTLELTDEERAFLRRWPANECTYHPALKLAIPIIHKLQAQAMRAEFYRDHSDHRDERHTWTPAQWLAAAKDELEKQ